MRLTKEEIVSIQNECGVKTVLSQNAKMKKSSQNGINLYNFGIPAFKSRNGTFTCPNAKNCVSGCYARQGAYIWDNVASAFEARLTLTRTKGFEEVIAYHIEKLLKRHKTGLILIRVHDSGDFYSETYQNAWYQIAKMFQNEPRVQFYAYTKMVSQTKKLSQNQPSNFRIIFSLGGTEDSQIDTENDFHSKVFQSEIELDSNEYINATQDDTIAALGKCPKLGLVYHGAKSYQKTTWAKVA